MTKLFTALGATALASLVLGLAVSSTERFPWEGLLSVHFVNAWVWLAAYIVVSRAYRHEKSKENQEGSTLLFLLCFLTVALFLGSVHNGLALASEKGVLLGERVYQAALMHPLSQALPNILLALGGLAVLTTMGGSTLPTLLAESEAARVIRKLNDELAQEKQKLQSVVEGIRAGLALVDPDGTILWTNEIYSGWFGQDAPLSGRDSREVLGLDATEAARWPHDRLDGTPGSSAQAELMFRTSGDERRPFLMSAYALLDESGKVTSHLQLLQDVSSEKAMRSQLMESEKLSAVGQLIGGVAHELNNPLAILVGYSELALMDDASPDTLVTTIDQIRKNTLRCQKVVKNLLSFVRRYKDEKTYSSLLSPIAAVAELKRHQLKIDNIGVEVSSAAALPSTMLDEHRMQQVFLNLVNNAHDAMAEQRLRGTIRMSAEAQGEWLIARVSDDGPGIPEKLRERVMSPFFTTKALGKGTGLGLAICKSIVEEHGGTLQLESPNGKGTTFTVRLPVVLPALDEQEASGPVPAAPPSRILVIDDEPEILVLMKKLLTDAGHTCTTAGTARAGLERVRGDLALDLVLCDLKMPEMDGFGMLDAIESVRPELVSRFAILSGDTANPKTREKMEARSIALLEKPYARKDVLALVNRLLARARPRPGTPASPAARATLDASAAGTPAVPRDRPALERV